MALKKNPAPATTEATDAKPAGAASAMFEDEGDTATAVREETKTNTVVEVSEADLKKIDAPAGALVVKNETAMALALKKPTGLDNAQNVIGIEQLEGMGIGAFPRITVDQGGFSRNKTDFLGSWIEVEVLSWNYVTLVTTGEKDDKDADKLIRSSYDHVNIPGEGFTVNEYLEKLRADGYDNASCKKYVEIYALLLRADKKGSFGEEPPMVQISVSPQSIKQWNRYLLESKIAAFRNKEITNKVMIGSERVVNGSNTYGVMQFGAKIAA